MRFKKTVFLTAYGGKSELGIASVLPPSRPPKNTVRTLSSQVHRKIISGCSRETRAAMTVLLRQIFPSPSPAFGFE
jgi:hypothetical protein